MTQRSGASAPFEYIQSLLAEFNKLPDDDSHPFNDISEDQEKNRLAVYEENAQGKKVYNYAVAKVRYRAPVDTDAVDVRVIFRLFTRITPGLQYVPEIYPLDGEPGPNVKPLLGLAGGEIVTIPFFAEERKPNLLDQTDDTNVTTLAGAGNQDVVHYVGCYLDLNRDNEKRFPLTPTDNTGQSGGAPLSILQLMRGLHQCLVAEIHYPPDPIPPSATPGSSDNLSQRNILFDKSDNPGGFATHLVHHTFELKPSATPLIVQPAIAPAATAGRLLPDELLIEWGQLPSDAYATLYLPQVDVDEVLRFAGARQGPPVLSKVDDHTLRCRITPITYIPIPGPRNTRIPGLLTIQLPPNLSHGQQFKVVARQAAGGVHQRFIGAFEFDIRVSHATDILPEAERQLSVLRHIALSIPGGNRWYAVFARWLDQLGVRIRAFGGDPDAIEPSPSGSGRRPKGERPALPFDEAARHQGVEGVVCQIIYDCFGRFEGFVLDVCPGRRSFRSCERALETLARDACRERATLIVHPHPEDSARPHRIVWKC